MHFVVFLTFQLLLSLFLLVSDVVWPDMETAGQGVLPRDSFQNKRFKLIPCMVEAPWVVQMAVSSTPVLLGQKVVQRYYRGEGYMEIDVHVGSSNIADNIVGVCRSYSKAFICNLGTCLHLLINTMRCCLVCFFGENTHTCFAYKGMFVALECFAVHHPRLSGLHAALLTLFWH